MLILGADTSGKNGSIALVQLEPGSARTLETVPLEGGTFSAQLVPQISDLLSRHNLTKANLDAFAVASGPGSFTGLRVGLAAIKALAEVLRKPIVAVSLLEVLGRMAVAAGGDEFSSGQISSYAVAINAGRGEVFVGQFELTAGASSRDACSIRVKESLLSTAELADLKKRNEVRWIATPDNSVRDSLRAHLGPNASGLFSLPSEHYAEGVARLGFEKITAGETVSPEALDANYIRRSDAEINRPTRP